MITTPFFRAVHGRAPWAAHHVVPTMSPGGVIFCPLCRLGSVWRRYQCHVILDTGRWGLLYLSLSHSRTLISRIAQERLFSLYRRFVISEFRHAWRNRDSTYEYILRPYIHVFFNIMRFQKLYWHLRISYGETGAANDDRLTIVKKMGDARCSHSSGRKMVMNLVNTLRA